MAYEGWRHDDGCVVCPHCNEFITVPDPGEIPDILRAADGHACEASGVQAHAGLASGAGAVVK